MKRLISFLSGAVTGAVVGAILALLFAPASGEELRLQVQERVLRLREEVSRAAAERRAELEKQLAALRAAPKKE